MPHTLVLTGPREVTHREDPSRPVSSDQVRLRTLCSGISHGTELNLYRGTAPTTRERFDPELRAFVPRDAGDVEHLELGYELVGEVVETGPGVEGVSVGDLVHAPVPHADEAVVEVGAPLEIGYPATLLGAAADPERGIFLALAAVALFAVHDARVDLGDDVAVFGLGTVGLLTAQMARLAGAGTVVGVEPVAIRREFGRRVGADATLDPSAVGGVAAVLKSEVVRGGVDTAIETSGTYEGLRDALASVRLGGRVVTVGFYRGGPVDLRLGHEWHHNRLEMVSSMGVWRCPHRRHPLWDRERVLATAADLVLSERVDTRGFVTHRVPFEDAERAYRLVDERSEETVKVILTY